MGSVGDPPSCSANYIEYQAGCLPLILGAPHGGSLQPSSIPTREAATYSPVEGRTWPDSNIASQVSRTVSHRRDQCTKELAQLISSELFTLCGRRPHVIINHLSRKKMDANRDMEIATFGVVEAEKAWLQFHQFIAQAQADIPQRGLYIDLHGQNHPEKWVELGYTLPAPALNSGNFLVTQSSICNLAEDKSMKDPAAFCTLVNGPESLGALIESEGYKAVPSPTYPTPESANYFQGGYNTVRYGSRNQARFDAIQIESPKVLRSKENIQGYAKALATALHKFLEMHYAL